MNGFCCAGGVACRLVANQHSEVNRCASSSAEQSGVRVKSRRRRVVACVNIATSSASVNRLSNAARFLVNFPAVYTRTLHCIVHRCCDFYRTATTDRRLALAAVGDRRIVGLYYQTTQIYTL